MRNYHKNMTMEEKRKMTSYLKLDSCRKIAGATSPDAITKKKYLIVYLIAVIIVLIGLISLIY